MSTQDPVVEAGAVASGIPLTFEVTVLETWMKENVVGFQGPLEVIHIKGGQSIPTYRLDSPSGSYILRRKPSGKLLKGAHDVGREAKVQKALFEQGLAVPEVVGTSTDESIVGTEFYIMRRVDGRIFWDASFPGVEQRADYFDAMNATLAHLHSIDPVAAGLEDYGRAGNYFERQIARWSKQYLEDTDAGRDPNMDALVEWLPDNIPPGDEVCVVHGDYRCDNMIFHPTEPRVVAVLDWELSTLGHPLADFAYHALMYRMPPDIVAGLAGADLAALGIPTEEEYVAAYCRRTGRSEIPNWPFYVAFNFFRLAAIFHGIKGRMIRGTAASEDAQERAKSFPRLAELARQAMDECR